MRALTVMRALMVSRCAEHESSEVARRVKAEGLDLLYLSPGVLVVDKPSGVKTVPSFGPTDAARDLLEGETMTGRWPKKIDRWRSILKEHAPAQVAAKATQLPRHREKFIRMLLDHRVIRPPMDLTPAEAESLYEELSRINAEQEAAEGFEESDSVASRLTKAGLVNKSIHRLDQATSGVLAFARDGPTAAHLSEQWRNRAVEKRYEALVASIVKEDGDIKLSLIRRHGPDYYSSSNSDDDSESSLSSGRRVHVSEEEQAKACLTTYRVLHRHKTFSHLELTPHTGRMHQLRAHCSGIDHPILGDLFYAPPDVASQSSRLCLHATSLSFRDPSVADDDQCVTVRSEPSWDLDNLGGAAGEAEVPAFLERARRSRRPLSTDFSLRD